MKEKDLAKIFISYFNDGHEVFQEVPGYGGRIIDFIAVNDNIRIAVEVKLHLNFEVIEQAYNNLKCANYSYIAVPITKTKSFAYFICEKFGIGVLTYSSKTGTIFEKVKPQYNRLKGKKSNLELKEYMKKSVAGSQNERVTAFKHSVEQIVIYLQRNDRKKEGIEIKKVLENIDFHWSSITSAKACITKWCKNGIIKQFKLEKGKLYLS